MKFVSLCVRPTVCLLLCVGCLGCSDQVAVDDAATAQSTTPAALDHQPVTDGATAKSSQDDDQPTALDRAKDLFRQADNSGDGVTKWLGDRFQDATDGGQEAADGSLEWANKTFESLKKQGLTTAGSAQEWVMEDYNSLGDWEYKVVNISQDSEIELTEAELNKLGSQRWECFSVVPPVKGGSAYLYHFKRQKKSYLKSLPFKDLMRLVPLMGGDGESN